MIHIVQIMLPLLFIVQLDEGWEKVLIIVLILDDGLLFVSIVFSIAVRSIHSYNPKLVVIMMVLNTNMSQYWFAFIRIRYQYTLARMN